MFEEWRVLHIDENEEESRQFCRALEENQFAGKCDTVRSIGEGKAWLEESIYAPYQRPRPDIVVLNWHVERDDEVLDFVRWLRAQPPFRDTPLAMFVGIETSTLVRERARNAGVTDMVNKPNAFGHLFEHTKEMLERCVSRCVAR